METIFMNTENSEANEAHRFRLTLEDKLNLRDPNKNIALANLSTYYHKQWFRGVLKKRCSEKMQQIYRRTPMPKCDFNKVAKQLY